MRLKLLIRLYTKILKDRHYAYLSFYSSLGLVSAIICLLCYSCNNKEKNSIKVIKEIVINASVGSDYPNLYYEKEIKKELIYFIDKVKDKEIKFFTTKGVFVRTTPLDEVLTNIDNIGRITIVSFDTIIINSNYTNEIIVIDRLGKIWKKYSLENSLIDSLGNQYELCSPIYPITQNPNSLLYSVMWRENLKDIVVDTTPKTDVGNLEYFYRKSSESAFFVNIKNLLLCAKPTIQFKCFGFYKNISTKSCVFAEPPSYLPLNETVIINSFYSNNLYFFNRDDFKLAKKLNVSSDYSSLGTNPLAINKEVLGQIQDSITFKEKTSGRIEKILFDKLKSEYYIIVRQNSSARDYDRNNIPFSIIILDSSLSKKSEYNFEDFKYKYYYTLLSSEGLLLFKNDTTKSLIKDEKVIYNLVKLY